MYIEKDRYAFDNNYTIFKYSSPNALLEVNEYAVYYSESLTFESAKQIQSELSSHGVFSFIIDEKRTIRNENELFDAIEKAANFPEWGRNWNAMLDWLSSFYWVEANGFVMIYVNPHQLIERHASIYDSLARTACYASGRWRDFDVPFKFLTAVQRPVIK